MPIIINNKLKIKSIIRNLNKELIFPRRYFSPSLNKVKIIGDYKKFENSEYLSERILCLPMYGSLSESIIKKIARIINASS